MHPGVPQYVYGAKITLLSGDASSGRFIVEAATQDCAAEEAACGYEVSPQQCCEGFTCQMTEQRLVGKCVKSTQDTYTLNLNAGWNMISVPVVLADKNYLNFDTDCEFKSVLWELNAESQRFQRATTIKAGRGYWIKTANSCTASARYTQKVALADYPIDLGKGWNLIGSQYDPVAFSEITNDCQITRGPFWYNPQTGTYTAVATTMEPGKGYLIKTSNACTITTEESAPPGLPTNIEPQ
jgi:hypothetical protein